MNKQLVQDIIKIGNKAIDTMSVKYVIETKDEYYYSYDRLYYDDNHVEFTDDFADDITLDYKDIIGIKLSNI